MAKRMDKATYTFKFPEDCFECPFGDGEYDICTKDNHRISFKFGERDIDCTLKKVNLIHKNISLGILYWIHGMIERDEINLGGNRTIALEALSDGIMALNLMEGEENE